MNMEENLARNTMHQKQQHLLQRCIPQFQRKTHQQPQSQQQGFILITVLLFVASLTVVAMSAVESSLLASKMSNYYAHAMAAFYQTETILERGEKIVLQGGSVAAFKKIASYCGIDYYEGIARGEYQGAIVNLRSTLAKIDVGAQCKDPPKAKAGRQSWVVVADGD